jgi:hypothetical protein
MVFVGMVVNTKVVDNFLILLVLKIHNYRYDSLEVMLFINPLSESACVLSRFKI